MIVRNFVKILLSITLLMVANLSKGQVFNWAKQFPLIGGSYAPFISKNGNSFTIGGTVGGTLHLDTIKISTSGVWSFVAGLDSLNEVKWAKSFPSFNSDYMASMTSDQNDNIILGGYYSGEMHIDSTLLEVDQELYERFDCPPCYWGEDAFLAKFDKAGNTLWTKSMIGLNNQMIYCTRTDSKNNIIVGAVVSYKFQLDTLILQTKDVSPYRDRPYAFVFKFSPDGKLLWYYPCQEISLVDDIIIDTDDNIFLMKEINSGASGIVKLSAEGAVIFDVAISDNNIFLDKGILDQHDNLIVSGKRKLADQVFNTVIMKVSADGDKILWEKEHHGMMDILTMEGDDREHFYIGGAISTYPPLSFMDIEINGNFRYCYARFDCTGNLEWFISPDTSNIGIITDILCEDDDLHISGYSLPIEYDFVIGDSSFSGNTTKLFIASFTDTSSIYCNDTITTNQNVDFHLIDLTSGTSDVSNINDPARTFIVYPTIVHEYLNINLNHLESGNYIMIEITNLSGSKVFQNEYNSSDLITINCSGLQPGFYIVTISDGKGINESHKVLKMR